MTTRHNVITVDVKATALEPVHQGGETTGTTLAELRREEMLVGDRVERIPVISANSIAHLLREATVFWIMDQIGLERFRASDVRAFVLLFTGGGRATRVGTASYIDLYEERELRSLFPSISLFGGTIGNRMLKGRLRVSNGVPVAVETREYLPDWLQSEASLSVYDLIQELEFSTFDPRENADYDHILDPEVIAQYRAEQEQRRSRNEGGAEVKLRRTVECLKAGTVLFFDLTLFYPTDIEFGTFLGGLGYFHERAYLGGKRNRGMGKVQLEFRGFEVKGLTRVERDVYDEQALNAATQHLQEHAEEIKQMIAAL